MPIKNYKLTFTETAKEDQKNLKRYILKQFKYKKYGESFTAKMKSAYKAIKTVNNSIDPLKVVYRGYDVYLLPYKTYLFFYIVDESNRVITLFRVMQNGMDWMPTILRWISQNP